MAKGAISKIEITKKILEMFEGSFTYNGGKEIRIPLIEEGEEIQIKVTLTAAKVNVAPGDEDALPQAPITNKLNDTSMTNSAFSDITPSQEKVIEASTEEKANVKNLLASLGL